MTDNVDHNVCTLNGRNTFHGMGIIAAITPKVNSSIIVPKKTVSTDSLIQIGRIETKFIERRTGHSPIKYQNLKYLLCKEDNAISLFWSCTWLLKPKRPLWNGFMQMIHTGSHAGESSVAFMPTIDLNPMIKHVYFQQCILLLTKQKNTMLTQY